MEQIKSNLFDVRKELGYQNFCQLAEAAYNKLPDDLKQYSAYETYIADPTHRSDGPKVGRNDPCPCGSGKKYKHCCLGK